MRFFRPRRGQAKAYTEQAEQEKVAAYINDRYPEVLWTASCGGMRVSIGTAIKMKRSGYHKGCADILILTPRRHWHGLLIELKRPEIKGICKKGSPSPEQLEFLKIAMNLGYQTAICYGFEETVRVIDNYFEKEPM